MSRYHAAPAVAALVLLALAAPGGAQMVSGMAIPGWGEVFGVDVTNLRDPYAVQLLSCSAPGNILWPGEQASFTFQLTNNDRRPLVGTGRVCLVQYGTRGQPGDIWVPRAVRIADHGSVPVRVNVAPGGFQNLTVSPATPATLGAYALVVDLGPNGRRWLTSYVRTFRPARKPAQYPQFCLDVTDVSVLSRLGAAPNRIGIGYKPTTDPDFEAWYQEQAGKLRAYKAAGLPITLEIGGGAFTAPEQPLGRPRPWLDPQGVMLETKFDLAWLPSYDADFRRFVKRFVSEFGWPRGPLNGIKLWNEPWEGISISGWGADMPRYREIFLALCEATDEARREAGVEVLIGGCDSSSNTFDKLFGDGSDDFLKYLDFCSIHYQGMFPPSTVRSWVDRKSPYGRVRVWDTESWVANVDDRVAAVVATNLSTGHDRAVGIYHGNIATEWYATGVQVRGDDGAPGPIEVSHTYSVAAAVGAVSHFIGERKFRGLLFRNGLPWVMLFDGLPSPNGVPGPDDGTVVVVGDIGEAFGSDCTLFRTARGSAETRHKAELARALAALPADAPADQRQALQQAMAKDEPLSGASMTLKAVGGAFGLFDFYGNPVPASHGRIVVPLDHRGFFLRPDGQPGSFAALTRALREARIEGIEPLAKECLDLTAPVERKPMLRLRLTNILNRTVSGRLFVSLGGLRLSPAESSLSLKGGETREVRLQVVSGAPSPDNTYPLRLTFDAGPDGLSRHQEAVHVNWIARRTIAVDGDLRDWDGVLPQTVRGDGASSPTLTEQAWLPFKEFGGASAPGFAQGFLACDEDYFYFAARVADSTPHEGTLRFARRDDDEFFYPEVSYSTSTGDDATDFSVRWTGMVQAPASGTWTFTTRSDDGVRLWVDSRQLVDNWTPHGDTEDSGSVQLAAGQRVPLKLEFYQGGGGATLQLLWQGPGQERQVIPAEQLFATAEASAGGLTGEYYLGTGFQRLVQTRVDPTLDFEAWPGSPDDPRFGTPSTTLVPHRWPADVRRYSYRKDPILPAGNAPAFDNIQIAFNVIPPDRKPWHPCPPGTMPRYTGYWDTDYEYALNQVAPRYGGGTEIWRLRVPGMPSKHFYPRQEASPLDGPVPGGQLVVTRDATTRYVECAIPWSEMPLVRDRLAKGETVKFTFRVNDDAGGGCLELSRKRSIAKRNGSLHADWIEHWANELEFGCEQPPGL